MRTQMFRIVEAQKPENSRAAVVDLTASHHTLLNVSLALQGILSPVKNLNNEQLEQSINDQKSEQSGVVCYASKGCGLLQFGTTESSVEGSVQAITRYGCN
eukprot:393336_1